MSLESFIGLDAGEGMSEAAFEAFKEKMKKAAAQIAAIQKEEKKQKKKEEELLKILLKFVKKSQKKELVLLISRVLEQNIPANFVLAVILLGNEDIQREVGDYLMLEGGKSAGYSHGHDQPRNQTSGDIDLGSSSTAIGGQAEMTEEKSLIFFGPEDETLPLKIKIRLDNWVRDMLFQAGETPQKLLNTVYEMEMIELPKESEFEEPKYEEKKSIKTVLIQLMAFVIRDFLEQNKISESYKKLSNFVKFILKGILAKTQETLEQRKLLERKEN